MKISFFQPPKLEIDSASRKKPTSSLRQLSLDLVEVLAAMLRAQKVDRGAGRRVLLEQFVRQRRDRLVGRARGLDGERGGPARGSASCIGFAASLIQSTWIDSSVGTVAPRLNRSLSTTIR